MSNRLSFVEREFLAMRKELKEKDATIRKLQRALALIAAADDDDYVLVPYRNEARAALGLPEVVRDEFPDDVDVFTL